MGRHLRLPALVSLALGPLALALLLAAPGLRAQSAGAVVPRPASVATEGGTTTLPHPLRIAAEPQAREVAALLAAWLDGAAVVEVVREAVDEDGVDGETVDAGASVVLRLGLDDPNPEAYRLAVTPGRVELTGATETGLIWGVQTLRQLLPVDPEADGLVLPLVAIADAPRFRWRGSLMDVSRHFFPVEAVERYIDLLAFYKMNVLHWHLTDDQGWRIEIDAYPRLTEVGAWRTEPDGARYGGFYTKAEVRRVVEYARRRGVTVVPEIEMPGHASAALVAYPELACADPPAAVPTDWGVFRDIFCVGTPEVFAFLDAVLGEVAALFPSPYVHIGGDEVPKERWRDCAPCQALKAAEGLGSDEALQGYFLSRVAAILQRHGKTMIGWDEILEGGAPDGAVVQVWRDLAHVRPAVEAGHPVVVSPTSHAYFDYSPAALPLARVYAFDPVPPGLPADQQALVLGGEGNLWSEYITPANFDLQAFPRVLALSEALWSPPGGDFADFKRRLDTDQYARLAALGVHPGPEDSDVLRLHVATEDGVPRVRVETAVAGLVVRARTDGRQPGPEVPVVTPETAFAPGDAVVLQPFLNGAPLPMTRAFTVEDHRGRGRPVTLAPPPDMRYPGPSPGALTDGLLGAADHRDGLAQGWWDHDLDATVDLGGLQPVESVALAVLHNPRAWILPPAHVTVAFSTDGVAWDEAQAETVMPAGDAPRRIVLAAAIPAGTRARYVRVLAARRALPPDHPGAGHPGWLFADELLVR